MRLVGYLETQLEPELESFIHQIGLIPGANEKNSQNMKRPRSFFINLEKAHDTDYYYGIL